MQEFLLLPRREFEDLRARAKKKKKKLGKTQQENLGVNSCARVWGWGGLNQREPSTRSPRGC